MVCCGGGTAIISSNESGGHRGELMEDAQGLLGMPKRVCLGSSKARYSRVHSADIYIYIIYLCKIVDVVNVVFHVLQIYVCVALVFLLFILFVSVLFCF